MGGCRFWRWRGETAAGNCGSIQVGYCIDLRGHSATRGGFVPLLRGRAGFRGYHRIDSGPDVIASDFVVAAARGAATKAIEQSQVPRPRLGLHRIPGSRQTEEGAGHERKRNDWPTGCEDCRTIEGSCRSAPRAIAYGRHWLFFRHRRTCPGDDDGRDTPSEPLICDCPGRASFRASASTTTGVDYRYRFGRHISRYPKIDRAMPNSRNPLAEIKDLDFARPALFRMKDRGMSEYDVFRSITSPTAVATVDRQSGHVVFRVGAFWVVARRDPGNRATVIGFSAHAEAA